MRAEGILIPARDPRPMGEWKPLFLRGWNKTCECFRSDECTV